MSDRYSEPNNKPDLIYFPPNPYDILMNRLCTKDIWEWDIATIWKAFFAKKYCRHMHKYNSMKLDISQSYSRYAITFVKNYTRDVLSKILAFYSDDEPLAICKYASTEMDEVVCRGVEHMLFMRDVLNEVVGGRHIFSVAMRLAAQAHARMFPVTYKLYDAYRRKTAKTVAPLRIAQKVNGKRYVSRVSGVYVFAVLYPVLVEHVGLRDYMDIFNLETTISDYIRRDLSDFIGESEAAKVAYILAAKAYRIFVSPYPSVVIDMAW